MAALLIEADIRTKAWKGNKVMRGIDHVVIAVNEIEKARKTFEKMGFKVTPKALHPFGTENFLVQLNGNFIEIVGVNDISLVPPHTKEKYSFAQANVDFLSYKEGMSSLVFQSLDARRDREEFLASGLHTYENIDFERKAKLPDGTSVIVGFSLAFLTNPETPNMTFFCCQQHAPEHFWKPEYQTHSNTAYTIQEIIILADEPLSSLPFFQATHGPDSIVHDGENLGIKLQNGLISLLNPVSFEKRFGPGTSKNTETPKFAGFQISVSNIIDTNVLLRNAGLEIREFNKRIQLGPHNNFDTIIEFVERDIGYAG